MTNEPSMLYPQEVEALLKSLERIKKLNSEENDNRKLSINNEVNKWIGRLQIVLRTRK